MSPSSHFCMPQDYGFTGLLALTCSLLPLPLFSCHWVYACYLRWLSHLALPDLPHCRDYLGLLLLLLLPCPAPFIHVVPGCSCLPCPTHNFPLPHAFSSSALIPTFRSQLQPFCPFPNHTSSTTPCLLLPSSVCAFPLPVGSYPMQVGPSACLPSPPKPLRVNLPLTLQCQVFWMVNHACLPKLDQLPFLSTLAIYWPHMWTLFPSVGSAIHGVYSIHLPCLPVWLPSSPSHPLYTLPVYLIPCACDLLVCGLDRPYSTKHFSCHYLQHAWFGLFHLDLPVLIDCDVALCVTLPLF